MKDIEWIEAAGVYVTLHTSGKEVLYRASLTDLAQSLDPSRFLRIHRSVIVNIESIARLLEMHLLIWAFVRTTWYKV